LANAIEVVPLKIDLSKNIEEILEKTGKECCEEIKSRAPTRKKGGGTTYRDGWTFKVDKKNLEVEVFNNGKDKTLSHLLEFGHLSRKGKPVAPQEHVRPSYNIEAKKYFEYLKKIEIK
jgi:hypothetical protein